MVPSIAMYYEQFNYKSIMSTHSRIRVDMEGMAMKKYSAFNNAPALLEPHHQFV